MLSVEFWKPWRISGMGCTWNASWQTKEPCMHMCYLKFYKLTFLLSSCCVWAWSKEYNSCEAAFKRIVSSVDASSQKCDRIFSEGIFSTWNNKINTTFHARAIAILDLTEETLGQRCKWISNKTNQRDACVTHTLMGSFTEFYNTCSFHFRLVKLQQLLAFVQDNFSAVIFARLNDACF